jgi:predicted negative regulator of RcsB-dependent stress response
MEKEAKQSADIYRLVAWAHANRKWLIGISAAILVVGAGIGIYNWNKSNREAKANEALSNIILPSSAEESTNSAADLYLKVAADYPGTSGGARALLIAAGILFDAGKFQDAEKRFEQFLGDYSDYPWADQAMVGVASCYEADGKMAEAATRYKDFVDRHPTASMLPQAKSALARAYLAENKPELALQQYDDLERNRNNDSWTAEAGIQKEELLARFPNLKKQPPSPVNATAPMIAVPPHAPTTTSAVPPAAVTNLTAPLSKPTKP